MNNNDIFQRLADGLNLTRNGILHIFGLAGAKIEAEAVDSWLAAEDDPAYQTMRDAQLEQFLDGYIVFRRGRSDGPPPPPVPLTNNQILRKLKIALNLKEEDIIQLLLLANFRISVSELRALFRRQDHPKFMPCGNQFLRNFLIGISKKLKKNQPGNPGFPKGRGERSKKAKAFGKKTAERGRKGQMSKKQGNR